MSSLSCVFFHTSKEIYALTQGGDFEKVSKNSWSSSLQEMELNSLSQGCGLDFVIMNEENMAEVKGCHFWD